jgi:heptaprenyl diphosphate synthase
MAATATRLKEVRPPGLERLPEDQLACVTRGLDDQHSLYDAVHYLVGTSGKQLRPAICLEAAKYGPRPRSRAVLGCATAVELFHMGSLAHDDIIDSGTVRRGRESLVARHGTCVAGLAAAWALGRAFELVTLAGPEALAVFVTASGELIDGQMMEAEDLFDLARTRERYLETIAGKTASLFWVAASLGARASGADEQTVEGLTEFGRGLGMVFQLSDDILDLAGSEEALGKPPGTDLRQGVYTLPVIYAAETEPGLDDELCHARTDESAVARVVNAVMESGAVHRAIDDCERYAQHARTALEGLPDREPAAEERLLGVLDYSLARAYPTDA